MQPVQDALVYVVDDDESVRQALAWLLRSRGLQTQCFDSAEGLIAHLGLDHAPQVPRQAAWPCLIA
jgi:two-component system response regulator DctR